MKTGKEIALAYKKREALLWTRKRLAEGAGKIDLLDMAGGNVGIITKDFLNGMAQAGLHQGVEQELRLIEAEFAAANIPLDNEPETA